MRSRWLTWGKVVRATVAAAASVVVLLLATAFGPTLFGYESSIVSSGSMGSAAPIGSVAQTEMVPVSAIRTGDIVSFRHAGRDVSITHRVVTIVPSGDGVAITTKGDANATADPMPVVVHGKIARVVRVIPFAGYIAHFAHTRAGWIVLFVGPIIGLLLERQRPARDARPTAEPWRQSPAA